uniref:Coiled-coil domain-containing protein 28B n=1 Tax=Anopheles melas TaxID=34690 RepID=A0A182UI50_9DIPT
MECDDAAVERQKLVSNDEEDDQNTITNLSSSGQAKSVQTPISPVLSNKLFSSGETSRSQNSTSYSLGKGIATDAPLATKVNYVNERKAQDSKPKAKKIQRANTASTSTTTTTTTSSTSTTTITTNITSATVANNSSASTNSNLPDGATTLAPPPSVAPSNSATAARSIALNAKTHNFSSRPLKHHSFISEVPDVRHMERALLGLLEDFHSGKLKAFGSGCTMEQMTSIREQQESLAKLHFDLGMTEAFTGGSNNPNNDNELQAQSNMKKLVQKLEQLSFSIEKLHSSNVEK